MEHIFHHSHMAMVLKHQWKEMKSSQILLGIFFWHVPLNFICLFFKYINISLLNVNIFKIICNYLCSAVLSYLLDDASVKFMQ